MKQIKPKLTYLYEFCGPFKVGGVVEIQIIFVKKSVCFCAKSNVKMVLYICEYAPRSQ